MDQQEHMKKGKWKLTIDRPVSYQINVPGELDGNDLDWNGGMTVSVDHTKVGAPITTLSIIVDQAGLHGLLKYIYSLGLPLISVNCIDYLHRRS